MKNKIWIVAQREYATRVKKRSFIILTILMPFLMAAMIFVPLLLSVIGDSGRKTVAVIDNTGLYADALQSNDDYLFVPTDKMTPALRSDSTDVAAVLMITDNLVDNPTAAAIYSRDEVKRDMSDYVNNALTKAVQKQKFERYNIPALNEIVEDVQTPVEVATVRWTDEGERESMTEIFSAVGMVLTTLIYFFVMSYGAMVMQSVTEEKTNRIVELMVSSVKPFQLMAGKIIGIGLVGITQMLIWGILLVAIISIAGVVSGVAMFDPSQAAAISAASQMPDADLSMQILSVVSSLPLAEIAVLFVLYFIGGYLLYASVLAGFGAAVNDPQDTQQFMMPIAVIMLFAFYAGFYSAMNPDGPLAVWCSFIPLTSPMVMMIRIPFGVPLWQEALSVALLFGTALALSYLSGKIYRVGILMYGKKTSLKEMLKWLKYKAQKNDYDPRRTTHADGACRSPSGCCRRRGAGGRRRGVRRKGDCTRTQPHRDADRLHGARRDAGRDVGSGISRWKISYRMHALRDRRAVLDVCRGTRLEPDKPHCLRRCRRQARIPTLLPSAVSSEDRSGGRRTR